MDHISRNSFTQQITLGFKGQGNAVTLYNAPAPCTPSAVWLKGNDVNRLVLVWPGTSDKPGLHWGSTTPDSQNTWTAVGYDSGNAAKGLFPANGSSISTVAFNGTVYAFFNSESHGPCFTFISSITNQYLGWSMFQSLKDLADSSSGPDFLDVAAGTTPSAVAHAGQMYVFWATPTGAIRYATSKMDVGSPRWVSRGIAGPAGLKISSNTSPAAVDFKGILYLFHHGAGDVGPWYTTLSNDPQAQWTGTVGVLGTGKVNGPRNLAKTSPGAFVWGNTLILMWIGASAGNTINTTSTTDGTTFLPSVASADSLLNCIPAGCSASGVEYGTVQFYFTIGKNNNIIYVNDFFDIPPAYYSDWMSRSFDALKDVPIPQICIPGTHDSGMSVDVGHTTYATPSTVKTQAVSLAGQLAAGCRWFDIRPCWGVGSRGVADVYAGHYSQVDNVGPWAALIPMIGQAALYLIQQEYGQIINTFQGGLGEHIEDMVNAINSFTSQHNELIVLNISHMHEVLDQTTNCNGSLRTINARGLMAALSYMSFLNHRVTPAQFNSMVARKGDDWKDGTKWTLADFLNPDGKGLRPAVVVVLDGNIMHPDNQWRPAGWDSAPYGKAWPPLLFANNFADFSSSLGLDSGPWEGVLPNLTQVTLSGSQIVQAYAQIMDPGDPEHDPPIEPHLPTATLTNVSTDHTPGPYESIIAWAYDTNNSTLTNTLLTYAKLKGLDLDPAHYSTVYMSNKKRLSLLPELNYLVLSFPEDPMLSKISGDSVGLVPGASTSVTDYSILLNMRRHNYFFV